MAWTVHKFGGTSVADATCVRRVAGILGGFPDNLGVVVSAMKGVTDDLLGLIPRKSARLLAKTLKSAIANAENNNNLSADSLTVKLAIIENGPVLKRFKAAARGSAAPRRKKMSHIRIVLSDGNTNS